MSNALVLGLLGAVLFFSGVVVGAVVTSLGEPPAPVDPPPSASVGEPPGPPPSTTRPPPLPPVPGEQDPNHTAPNGPLPQKPGTLIPGR